MDKRNLQILLDRAGVINERYRQENMDSEFNVFSILRKEHEEVGLHSRFIYELLNPKGIHYHEDKFLKLFLDHIGMEYYENDLKNYKVEREYRVNRGQNDDQYNNFDILISYGDKAYVIENKIHEEESIAQLETYYDIIKEKFVSKKVILLTLFSHKLSEKELGKKLEGDFISITYRDQIKEWLTECIKETAQKPLLRESLVMYRNLILNLTGQSYSERMVREMKGLLMESRKNFEIALELEKSLPEAKIDIQKLFWTELENKLAEYKLEKIEDDIHNWSFANIEKFYTSRVHSEHGLSYDIAEYNQILLRFWITTSTSTGNIQYSFCIYDENKKQLKSSDNNYNTWEKVREVLSNKLQAYVDKNEWCPGYRDSSKNISFIGFDNDDTKALLEDESRRKIIGEIAEEVDEDIKKFKAYYKGTIK